MPSSQKSPARAPADKTTGPAAPRSKQDTLFVGALAKGLRLLRAFDRNHTEMSLTELARQSGLDKSAVQRLANTLTLEGFLVKDPVTRRFRPSHAWLELAYVYYWSDPLVALAMPKLIGLSQRLGETVNMAEISGTDIVYVTRLPCQRTHFAATVAGRRLPALCTSAGRAILSTRPEAEWRQAVADWPLRQMTPRTTMDRDEIAHEIAETAQRGYGIAQGQMILNEIGVSAPIFGPDGTAHAAVQCSVSAFHWTPERVAQEIVPDLIDTANTIAPGSRG